MTKSLRKEVDSFKREAEKKEKEKLDEVRCLQAAMGDIQVENARSKAESENEPSLIESFYKDVFKKDSNTRNLLDLNNVPPSELALEGTLVVLKTMTSNPVGLTGFTKVVDYYSE